MSVHQETAVFVVGLSKLAALLGCSRRTAAALVKRGDFPAPRMLHSSRPAWVRGEIEEWVRELPAAPAKPEPAQLRRARERRRAGGRS
jgi:predicted DNA-binding transcriptional regulator AlpA